MRSVVAPGKARKYVGVIGWFLVVAAALAGLRLGRSDWYHRTVVGEVPVHGNALTVGLAQGLPLAVLSAMFVMFAFGPIGRRILSASVAAIALWLFVVVVSIHAPDEMEESLGNAPTASATLTTAYFLYCTCVALFLVGAAMMFWRPVLCEDRKMRIEGEGESAWVIIDPGTNPGAA